MFFSLDISLLTVLLLAIGFAAGIIYVTWQWMRVAKLRNFVQHDEQLREYAELLPPVSIIVDACNDTEQLPHFLPLILEQEYPEYEVIVVANSAAEATSDHLSALKAAHDNLHITFVPSGTRTLSRKKLALMIGIKASKYDIILTTCANCCATSDQMLRLVMRNFTDDTDIVLGYAHYDYEHDKRWGRRMRVFDTVSTGAQWTLSAVKGHPYRGVTECLAYRKRLFYDNRGFARSMDLRWGEDDIFLSQIAHDHNARVELLPDSQITVRYDNPRWAHRLLKMRRDFTSRFVRRKGFVVQGLMSLLWWLSLLAFVAAVVTAWPNAVVLIAAALAWLLLGALASWALARLSHILQAPRLWLTAPLLALWRPVVNGYYRLRELRDRHSNYTSYI